MNAHVEAMLHHRVQKALNALLCAQVQKAAKVELKGLRSLLHLWNRALREERTTYGSQALGLFRKFGKG